MEGKYWAAKTRRTKCIFPWQLGEQGPVSILKRTVTFLTPGICRKNQADEGGRLVRPPFCSSSSVWALERQNQKEAEQVIKIRPRFNSSTCRYLNRFSNEL